MKKQVKWIISVALLCSILISVPLAVHAASRKMSIQWQGKKRTVTVGKKLSLKVKIRHKKSGSKLVWKSASKKIATVSKHGVVTGKKAGKVRITVKIKGTAIKRSCTIRVKKTIVSEHSADKNKKPQPKQSQRPSVGNGSGGGSMNPGSSVSPTDSAGQQEPDYTDKPDNSTDPEKPGGGTAVPTAEPGTHGGSTAAPTTEPGSHGGSSTAPTGKPTDSTNHPTAAPSQAPIYVPEAEELVPYFTVTDIDGETMTVYLIHRNYEGQIHVSINGKEFTASGNAQDALLLLARGGTTKTDSAGTLRISRETEETGVLAPYWTVEDLIEKQSYQMRAETRNILYPNYANCGVIYFRGDVTSVIEVY